MLTKYVLLAINKFTIEALLSIQFLNILKVDSSGLDLKSNNKRNNRNIVIISSIMLFI